MPYDIPDLWAGRCLEARRNKPRARKTFRVNDPLTVVQQNIHDKGFARVLRARAGNENKTWGIPASLPHLTKKARRK